MRFVLGKKTLSLWSKRATLAALIAGCALVWSAPVNADPPPWAPAWGYRAKHGPKHGHKNKHKRRHHVQQQQQAAYVPPFDIGSGRCNRELIGGLLGAAAGGLAGSQIGDGRGQLAATAGGTLLGFLIGGSIGRTMDDVDQSCLNQSLEHAQDGQQINWNNPDSGAKYQVVPTKTMTVGDDTYCREYITTATVGGRIETAHGKACRQPDGTWRIKS